jgi:hypothetical protein
VSDFAELLQDVAGGLGIPRAADEALAFVRRGGIMPAGQAPRLSSDVAPGALPVEISFSQANPRELRILIEPCQPGEGILARTVMGIASVGNVTKVFSKDVAQQAQDLVRGLLPESEQLCHLSWRSSVWLALRSNGERSAVRIYVNGQFSDAQDRWRRMGRAFSDCGLEESRAALEQLRHAVGDLLLPIGLCFDVQSSGVTPARVHGVTEKVSPFWLLRLLTVTGNEAAADDAADFLDLFGMLERRGACPVLVSLGLETGSWGSLKIDVDLPNLEPDIEIRRSASYLAKAEKRFGEIAAYQAVSRTLNGAGPRYIGMTIRSTRRHLNVYFPNLPAPDRVELPCAEQALEKARAFVCAQVQRQKQRSGALLMDARSSGKARVVPEEWPDLYMTCLLVHECAAFLHAECDALQRARSYVRAAREGWSWRYLPDLPPDLDDTAMAWAALDRADRRIDSEVVGRVMANRNSDGGFRTFIGKSGENQPSHPAVTLNVAFALDEAHISWSGQATYRYLERWLYHSEFPACPWMGSALFPIYLFARSSCLLQQLGAAAMERLAARVMEMRRGDGTWGGALPDSLSTALAVVSLDRLGFPVSASENLERFFLESQFDDGGWGWSPLYSDGNGTWFGHRAITTMFVIGAMRILKRSM